MSNRSKRLSIFRSCAPSVKKLFGCKDELYFCPICGKGYSEDAAYSGELLTLEDVPPRNMGGKGLLLTCRTCNSDAGRKLDFHIKSRTELNIFEQILTGKSNEQKTSANLIFNGESYPVSIKKTGEKTEIILKPNNPKKIDILKDHMITLSESNRWDGYEFNINKTVKCDIRLLKLAFLKSGFLLITAMLGYRYAFDQRLSIVREQLQSPESELLGTCFWIEPGKDDLFPKRRIISVTDPLPLFLVTYDKGAVILPNHSSPIDLYEIIQRNWEKGRSISFTGEIYRWPEKPVFALDNF
jgi:hypothetical protein